MRVHRFLRALVVVLAVVLGLAGLLPRVAMGQGGIVPATVIQVTAPATTINNGPGDQFDPHISGDYVSYTSSVAGSTQIRYHNLVTGVDQGIANTLNGVQTVDSISDVSGSRIVFTRTSSTGRSVWLSDITTGVLSELGSTTAQRSNAAIGDQTVAWQESGAVSVPEIIVHDLNAGSEVQLTNDSVIDRFPAVSPAGNVVAWEKCASGTCDVWQAVKGASGWTVSQVTNTPESDLNPETNGTIVVYNSSRVGSTTGSDIFWTPVAGGVEQHLALADNQIRPAISGNFIAFESFAGPGGPGDIFVYDVATNTLYQVTNTPAVHETLTDLWLGPDGFLRVVYTVSETDQNVYVKTFFVGTGGADPIADLIALVQSFNLQPHGIENSLVVKLQHARDAFAAGDVASGCALINAFINEVQAQTGKHIAGGTGGQADQLLTAANRIKSAHRCP